MGFLNLYKSKLFRDDNDAILRNAWVLFLADEISDFLKVLARSCTCLLCNLLETDCVILNYERAEKWYYAAIYKMVRYRLAAPF